MLCYKVQQQQTVTLKEIVTVVYTELNKYFKMYLPMFVKE